MELNLPEKVNQIIETLAAHGYEAYAVGGCVRDSILGRSPEDWDITTSAKPEEVKAIFPRTVDTGIKHGTVTVLMEKEGFEVTTYRIDGEYEDNRHPKEVIFTENLLEDLKRRDFTINAMAYNDTIGMVDAFGGVEDLKNKRICCVGEPKERFGEDALRILRGVRFGAQLGFAIEGKTIKAMRELAWTLEKISAERIQAELVKLLKSKNPDHIALLEEFGIAKVILPEYHGYSSKEQKKILEILQNLEQEAVCKERICDQTALRMAAVCFFLSEEESSRIMRRLKFDNRNRRMVEQLIRYQKEHIEENPVSVRKALAKMGEEIYFLLLDLKYAAGLESREGREKRKTLAMEILERGQCISIKGLKITGKELMELGIPKGPVIGELLEMLLEKVLEEPELNQREFLLKEARKEGNGTSRRQEI